MKIYLALLFYFLFVFNVKAQTNFIETKNAINSFAVSDDEKYVAIASNNILKWISVDNFKVIDSFELRISKDFIISTIKIFGNNNGLLLKQKPIKRLFTSDNFQYPQDSIHLFNIAEKKIISSAPGNVFLEFFENPDSHSVVAYNNYFASKDSEGNAVMNSERGELQTSPSKIAIDSPGVICHLVKHPIKNELILIYYRYDENFKRHYIFEVRNSKTLELIKNKEINVATKIENVSSSKDGRIWKLDEWKGTNKVLSTYINYETLEQVPQIEAKTVFPGWMIDGKIVAQENNGLKIYNASTQKLEHEIWANLTKFGSINNFYALNTTSIIVVGSALGSYNKTGIQKISLDQLEIYTKLQEIPEKSILFDPNVALIGTNDLKTADNVYFNFYQDWFLFKNGRTLEFWNIKQQKKWRTLSFSQQTSTNFSENAMKLLVFEKAETKSSSDFVMKVIDLKTGAVQSKLFNDKGYDFIDPLGYSFIPTDNPNEWIGRDYQSIWLVDAEKMEFKLVKKFENQLFPDKIIAVKNNQVLFNVNERTENPTGFDTYADKGYYWLNLATKLQEKIPNSEDWKNVSLLASKNLAFTSKNGFYLLENNQVKKIKDFEGESKNSYINEKGLCIQNDRGFSIIDYKGIEKKIQIDDVTRYNGFGVNSKDVFVLTYDNLYTYHTESSYLNQWKTSQTKNLFHPKSEIQIHPSGQILWRNKLFINLNTLTSEQKYELSEEAYLFDKLPYVVQKKFNQDTQKYHFYINTFDEAPKVIWMSSALKTDDDLFNNLVSNFIFSESENQMIGYQEEPTSIIPVNYFFWADWKKNISKTIVTKNNIRNIYKTLQSDVVEVVFENSKSNFFNIVLGRWENNFNAEFNKKDTPFFNGFNEYVEWKDSKGTPKKFYSRTNLNCGLYSAKLDKLIAGSEGGKVFVWNLDNSSPLKIIPTGSTESIVRIIENGNKLIAVDAIGSLHFIDPIAFKRTLSLFVNEFEKDKYSILWSTPEGFYSAEKSALRNFHFIKRENVLPLSIFDVYLNRPEKILEKLANTDTTNLNLYKEATQKRMNRMGISATVDFWNIERPQISFEDAFLPQTTTDEHTIDIPLNLSENSKDLEVYNNGVLVTKVTDNKHKNYKTKVVLHSGENNINIISKDKNQIESEPLSFKIVNKNPPKSKTYYVGIGISTYKDSTMNLKFAVKDVEKLETYFSRRYRNDSIQVIKLLNEEVTTDNIKKIKDILKNTNVDDKVIISFSGHGLINTEKEFYFAGYNTNFNSPEKQSISYDLIQSLTDNIPARRRLILIDACHSGSLDSEEELVVTKDTNIKEHDIKGSIVVKSNKTNSLESFEQMQNMFFDLNKSNGTIIIAASGGKEYAYEGKEWNNGVFTYSLIQTLEAKGYDTWKGEVGVPVSILQKEVYKKVSNLTKGKQKPTARTENPEWDWEL